MLASQLGGYSALTGSCALPHTSLGASPKLAMSPTICWMCSTDSPQHRILYCIIPLDWRSLLGLAPAYLRDLCCTTKGISGCRSLRSAEPGFLIVPFGRTTKPNQNHTFSVVDPLAMEWAMLGTAIQCEINLV